MLHRILATKTILYKMVLEDGDVCEICRCEKDNIQYIFGNVNLFKFMVKQENMLNKCRISIRMILSETLDLFACSNNFRTDAVFYLILQIANSYIYSCKCEKKISNLNYNHWFKYWSIHWKLKECTPRNERRMNKTIVCLYATCRLDINIDKPFFQMYSN